MKTDVKNQALPRPEVLKFAEAMEIELRKHDGRKRTWQETPDHMLFALMVKNVGKYADFLDRWHTVPTEVGQKALVDIANFAMMIRDNIESRTGKADNPCQSQ